MTIRRSVLIAIITAAAVSASGIAAFFLIVPATSYNNSTAANSHEESSSPTRSWIPVKDAAVLLQIGDVPEQQMMESGYGTSDQTTFLPISITYTMTFANPTRSFVFYPIDTALWNGWIGARHTSTMVNGNNQAVPFAGSTRDSLGSVNATCKEPYYAKVDSENGHSVLFGINRTSKAVSNFIPWGASTAVSFDNSISPMLGLPANLTRTGTFHLTENGSGIVPANYTGSTPLNNFRGTGNDQVAGMYHLTFDTFYNNTTVQLPKSANTISAVKEVCLITPISSPAAYADTDPVRLFSSIYVYDIWFRMPK